VAERARSQLRACLGVVAELDGGKLAARKGDYAWSEAYQAIRKLWVDRERFKMLLHQVAAENKKMHEARQAAGWENELADAKTINSARDMTIRILTEREKGNIKTIEKMEAEMASLREEHATLLQRWTVFAVEDGPGAGAWVTMDVRCPDCCAEKKVKIESLEKKEKEA